MKKVVLFLNDKFQLEFLKEYLNYSLGIDVFGFVQERDLLTFLQSQSNETIYLFYETTLNLSPLKKWITDHNFIIVTKVKGVDHWISTLKEYFKNDFRLNDGDFIHVNVQQVQDFKAIPCSVYLKLGPSKFVCVIKTGEVYAREILNKYISKEINRYYIHKDDLRAFIEYNTQIVLNEIKSKRKTEEMMSAVHVSALDHVVLSLRKFGINDYNVELMTKSFKDVCQLTKNNATLFKRIESLLNQGSFLAIHSVGSSFLAIGLSQFLDWNSEMTRKKLVLASLFHDISLESEKLVYLNSESQNLEKYLTPVEMRDHKEHPEKSLLILSRMMELPANVNEIILEHHELPDGSGFPKKLDFKTISPLAACFIVAEELFHALSEVDFDYTKKEELLLKLSKKFNKGQFVDLLEAVNKLLDD